MKRFAPALLLLSAVGVVAACEGTDLDTAATSTTQALGDDATAEIAPPPHGPPPGHCAPPLTDDARAADEAARAAFHANHGEHRSHRPPPPDGAPRGRPGHRHGDPLLAVYDDDADGTLSDAERAVRDADLAAGCTARNAEDIAAFDVDGDALLNASEWAAAREAHHAEHRARFDRRNTDVTDDDDVDVVATWDADGDGVLSITERRALNTTLRSLVREGLRLPRSALSPVTTKMATVAADETVVEERP